MKKKLLVTALVASFALGSVFAGDFSFKFGSLAQRPGYLAGIIPTYYNVGFGYDGISLLEGQTTELQYFQGAGFTQRIFYQDTSGDQTLTNTNPQTSNLFSVDSTVNLKQGFLEDDILTANIGVKGAFENIYDDDGSIVAGTTYPDLTESTNWYSWLISSVKYDKMSDNIFTQDGYSGELTFTYGPSFTNSTSDFYSAVLDLQYAKTLYTLQSSRDGQNLVSLVLINRLETSYTDGDKVPTSYQGNVALGNKVRGFSYYTYNTNFTVVNNLDLRIGTFEMTDYPVTILPRFNIFVDTGFAAGNYLNSDVKIDPSDSFLMSTGLQATVDLGDLVDLGYQIAYLINGSNLSKDDGTSLVGSVTFFLMF